MSLALSILASGSAGNCSVLRCSGGTILIDCGIGPRIAAKRMESLGANAGHVAAICLTHLDRDHFNPIWIRQIIQQGILVFCHESRIDELSGICGGESDFISLIRPFNGKPFSPADGIELHAIRLAHDELGSHGFVIEGFGGRIGYATDLGHASAELVRRFRGVDVLAIESNYDPQMQLNSERPAFLKRRIMGGRGHLSNAEALNAVRQILDQAEQQGLALPGHIVLLHRSRQCNCPKLLRDLFSADQRIGQRLVLAEQNRPTPWLPARKRPVFRQLELQWA
jgi:phosphoribosyl 1,2-cyclic phosphodiesterase